MVNTKNPSNKKNVTAKRSEADSTFPKYVDTGNPEKDRDTYKVAKAEWIKNNPEKYKAMMTTSAEKGTSSNKNANQQPVRKTSK